MSISCDDAGLIGHAPNGDVTNAPCAWDTISLIALLC